MRTAVIFGFLLFSVPALAQPSIGLQTLRSPGILVGPINTVGPGNAIDTGDPVNPGNPFQPAFPGVVVSLAEAKRVVGLAISGHIAFETASLVMFGDQTFNGKLPPPPAAPAGPAGFSGASDNLPEAMLQSLQHFSFGVVF